MENTMTKHQEAANLVMIHAKPVQQAHPKIV